VLQALDAGGAAQVAVVADHDVSYRHPRLRVDLVAPLTGTDIPALAIPYDGNLNIPGLSAGPGSRVEQVLVAPGVVRIEERDVPNNATDERPTFQNRPLTDGMSDPWLDLTGTQASTAVRFIAADDSVRLGLVEPGSVQLTPIVPAAEAPPLRWSGLPRDFPVTALRDDVVWWTQQCREPTVSVQLVWVGNAPGFPAPVRVEFVRCPGGNLAVEALTGVGGGTRLVNQAIGEADAYAMSLAPATSLGRATVLIIGSTRVDSIAVGDEAVTGRVLQRPALVSGPVQVFDAAGRSLRLR
jgi:hypothetical protein